MRYNSCILLAVLALYSCSPGRTVARSARKSILAETGRAGGHAGISLYEPATGKYWYSHHADRYFVPASTVKIATCYAAMKYLGDSLAGLRYIETDSVLIIEGVGDPTLLHPDFGQQKVADFIRKATRRIELVNHLWRVPPYGTGWAWDDYNYGYMAERSDLPVYGNVSRIRLENGHLQAVPGEPVILLPSIDEKSGKRFKLERNRNDHFVHAFPAEKEFSETTIPLANVAFHQRFILKEAFKKDFELSTLNSLPSDAAVLYSRPTDSLLRPMMYRSDNFFAEQALLMVSNKVLGVMSDERIIDTLLKTDFRDLPQKPRWVDGSGLSRYNLFTPRDLVFILDKMERDFGMERVKAIFPTGGEGTLSGYYQSDSGYLFAKTGSLSGVVSLSGYLYTRKGRLLLFSVMVNNQTAPATVIRRATERFLREVRRQY